MILWLSANIDPCIGLAGLMRFKLSCSTLSAVFVLGDLASLSLKADEISQKALVRISSSSAVRSMIVPMFPRFVIIRYSLAQIKSPNDGHPDLTLVVVIWSAFTAEDTRLSLYVSIVFKVVSDILVCTT